MARCRVCRACPASVLQAASPHFLKRGALEPRTGRVGKSRSLLDSELEPTQIDTPGYAFDARGSSIDDDDNPFKNT